MHALLIGIPWPGIGVAVAYGLLVRFVLRRRLARRWTVFRERQSAPYFVMFGALLAFCAFQLLLGLQQSAAPVAMTAYFILAAATIVETVQARNANQ